MTTENALFDPQDIEALLQKRRAEVLTLIDEHGEDSRPVELDQTRVGRLSRMDALQNQAMAQATQSRRELELTRIDEALKRLADGEYGECLSCGEPIAQKRLAFDPSATLCIDCADQSES